MAKKAHRYTPKMRRAALAWEMDCNRLAFEKETVEVLIKAYEL